MVSDKYRSARLTDESGRTELENAMKEICGVYQLLIK